jgi:hypothetical protein
MDVDARAVVYEPCLQRLEPCDPSRTFASHGRPRGGSLTGWGRNRQAWP